MSFLEYRVKTAPTGFAKVFALNWALVLVVTAVAPSLAVWRAGRP